MASSNTISLIFIISTITGFIECVGIEFGPVIQKGQWNSTHETSFPLIIGDEHYFFGIKDNSTGKFWFICELGKDGSLALETSTGTWYHVYNVLPFTIDRKQFIFGIRDQYQWFIHKILPGGLMGTEMSNGHWPYQPITVIFPFYIGGKHYVFSLTGTNWFINEFLPNGTMVPNETDSGLWEFEYTSGFPFWINGRQYFYCLGGKHWFIRELLYGGKMGKETANGHWMKSHRLYVPFNINHEYYFHAAIDKTSWFVQELLPAGKMGAEKEQGSWQDRFDLSFTLSIESRKFFYGVSEFSWFVREIIPVPKLKLPIIDLATSRKNHCDAKKVSRRKRQNNGTCNPQCQTININDTISAIEEYFSSIENDVNDGYDVLSFNSQDDPVTLVATFRVSADATHSNTVDLTALIRAKIHRRHMSQQTDSIPPEMYEYLRQMDKANDDEAGHLLASSLGGVNLPFNFAPQSLTLNGTIMISGSTTPQPGWYAVEEMLRDYLINMSGDAYIRWALAPIYSLLPSTNSRRPTNFLLTVRFYDAQNEPVNWTGKGALLYFNFLNAPTEACKSPSNHPWWDWSKLMLT